MEKVYISHLVRNFDGFFMYEPYHDPVFDKILEEEKKKKRLDCLVGIRIPQPIEQYNAEHIEGGAQFLSREEGYAINLQFPFPLNNIDADQSEKEFRYIISHCLQWVRKHTLKEKPIRVFLYRVADWLFEPIFY